MTQLAAIRSRYNVLLYLLVVVGFATLAVIGANALRADDTAPTGQGMYPHYVDGNDDCTPFTDDSTESFVKIEWAADIGTIDAVIGGTINGESGGENAPPITILPNLDGSYTYNVLTDDGAEFSVTFDSAGDHFDFESSEGVTVDAVVAKASDEYNLYAYSASTTGTIYTIPAKGSTPAFDITVIGLGHEVSWDTDLFTPLKDPEVQTSNHSGISHVSLCYDRNLVVSKTAAGTYGIDHDWSIDKSVTDGNTSYFPGETANYLIDVIYGGSEKFDYAVGGEITIYNPWNDSVTVSSVSDSLNVDGGTLTLEDIGTGVIAGGDSLVLDYSIADAPHTATSNNVEVETAGTSVEGGSFSAPFTYQLDVNNVSDDSVTITDSMFPEFSELVSAAGKSAGDVASFPYSVGPLAADAGSIYNQACLDNDVDDNDGNGDENGVECDDVTITVYPVTVSKTADTTYFRDYDWTIAKELLHNDSSFFPGETANYNVSVTASAAQDFGHAVSGTIYVSHSNPDDSLSVTVTDQLNAGSVSVDGDGTLSIPAAGLATVSTASIGYSSTSASTDDELNTATASWNIDGATGSASGTADVVWAADPIAANISDHSVVVGDDLAGWEVELNATDNATWSKSYSLTNLQAHTVNGAPVITDITNTACLDDDMDDTDNVGDANGVECSDVTITVYPVTVTKTASTSYDRTFIWTINKTAFWIDYAGQDPVRTEVTDTSGPITDSSGLGIEVEYDITVSTTSEIDSNYFVDGDITVSHSNPDDSLTVTVTDQLNAGSVSVDGDGTLVIPAAGTASVSENSIGYNSTSTSPADVLNTATATWSTGSASGDVVIDWSEDAAYIEVLNPTWSVSDPGISNTSDTTVVGVNFEAGDDNGIVGQDGNYTGTLITTITSIVPNVANVCDQVTWTNTATVFFGIGSATDDAQLVIDQTCAGRLTRTPGYWKTHNDTFQGLGGPQTDTTWNQIPPSAELSDFFVSGLSYYGVLTAPDGGSPYITLGRAYIAAELNVLAGTVATEDALYDRNSLVGVDLDLDQDGSLSNAEKNLDVMAVSAELLSTFNPATIDGFDAIVTWVFTPVEDGGNGSEFPTRKELRGEGFGGNDVAHFFNYFSPMLVLAEYLDDYNNGANGIGPGHGD